MWGMAAAGQFEQQATKCVDIAGFRRLGAVQQFGGRIACRPGLETVAGQPRQVSEHTRQWLAEAVVEQPQSIFGEYHVARFDVAVDDAAAM